MDKNCLAGKKILITGGTGSLGRRLARRILDCEPQKEPQKLLVFSRDEFKQSEMARDFPDENIRFFIGDIRDRERLYQALSGVDYVVHAAALKQVPILEYCPDEAIKTNVYGTMNVIDACIAQNVQKCVLISTDKAVNPINLYGATKLCAEKLFLAANAYNKTGFSCVRYGNVIGSRGSVIPLFKNMAKNGIRTFPITDLAMTRFWLTLDEAVDLVLYTLNAQSGYIYVPEIPSMKITSLAKALCPECAFSVTGIRPGEKLHERLISEDNKFVRRLDREMRSWTDRPEPYTSDKNPFWMTEKGLRIRLEREENVQSAHNRNCELGAKI